MKISLSNSLIIDNQLIGQGAYSKVYKNTKFSEGSIQTTAVKVYQKSKQNIIDHAKRQRNILKNLHSQYICEYRQSLQSTHRFYMVQKLQVGITLDKLIQQNKKLSEKQVIKITKAILQGLQYLHSKGIMHRDLKPANIMYQADKGKAVILDLGFACYFHKNDERILTASVGTPYYMSPQILMGQKYNSKSDIWSLGIIIYQLLSGHVPFEGRNQKQILNTIFNNPLKFKTTPSYALESIIKKCLKIDIKQRISWQQLFQWKQTGRLSNKKQNQNRKHKKYNSFSSINLESEVKDQSCNCNIF